jgi:hypothetical protein
MGTYFILLRLQKKPHKKGCRTRPVQLLCGTFLLLSMPVLCAFNMGTESTNEAYFHHFELSCENCHNSQPMPFDQQVSKESLWVIEGDINKMCTTPECHTFDPKLSHPVGVTPSGSIPSDLPLDNNSRITCVTCHKEKNQDITGYGDLERDSYLRRSSAEELCQSCHLKMNSSSAESSHWVFSARAHLDRPQKRSAINLTQNDSVDWIDRESYNCLSCHDDVTVTIPGKTESFANDPLQGGQMQNHPIGMDYRSTSLFKSNFRLLGETNAHGIRLFDERVGCGSCHSLYAQTPFHLVADHKDSTLCRSCHDL